MVTSSLLCGASYILYIDLPCAHYAGNVTSYNMSYIVHRIELYTKYKTLNLYHREKI